MKVERVHTRKKILNLFQTYPRFSRICTKVALNKNIFNIFLQKEASFKMSVQKGDWFFHTTWLINQGYLTNKTGLDSPSLTNDVDGVYQRRIKREQKRRKSTYLVRLT